MQTSPRQKNQQYAIPVQNRHEPALALYTEPLIAAPVSGSVAMLKKPFHEVV